VIAETPQLCEGGTLAVLLGCHALRRGYEATICTCNLQVFDPTWFWPTPQPLRERLRAQLEAKDMPKLRVATEGYFQFLDLGGQIRMEDFTGALIRRHLKRDIPILTGLSATNLYRCAREFGPNCEPDDIHGLPVGHFVVLCGYDRRDRTVLLADPWLNPKREGHRYSVCVDHLIRSILLGILTYDANLLIIHPGRSRKDKNRGRRPRQEAGSGDPDGR
jgi:hypothetical protein